MTRTSGSLPVAKRLRPTAGDAAPDLALVCTRIPAGEAAGLFYPAFRMEVVPLADLADLPIDGEA